MLPTNIQLDIKLMISSLILAQALSHSCMGPTKGCFISLCVAMKDPEGCVMVTDDLRLGLESEETGCHFADEG